MIDILAETGALINLIIVIVNLILQKITFRMMDKDLLEFIFPGNHGGQKEMYHGEKI